MGRVGSGLDVVVLVLWVCVIVGNGITAGRGLLSSKWHRSLCRVEGF